MARTSVVVMVLAAAVAALTGCRTVPISGRSQLMLSSEGYENSLGAETFGEYKQKYKASANQAHTQALKRVGEAIKGVAGQDSFAWEFTVLDSPEPNAFCLPGGKVAVYSGIFNYMSNDAELACVVAHEVAHALARHGGERMSWAQVQSLGLMGLLYGNQSETVAALYGLTTDVGVMLPFSRSNETEADAMGLILMARAGYNPQAALTFWQKFGTGGSQSALASWLSTHPGGEARIRDLQEAMPNAMKEYQSARNKKDYGVIYGASPPR
ncbi:MAG: M48 family metallopeptidase [Kiritimatiellaeota bacterium]|nr:M48 family metallopeptidase [Kiritimatiellota bacterium]